MTAHRMNRDQFFAKLAVLDEDGLRKALWTLYWRGSAPVRERIEEQLEPEGRRGGLRHDQSPADPAVVLGEVRDLVEPARSGRTWPATGACHRRSAHGGAPRSAVWRPTRKMPCAPVIST